MTPKKILILSDLPTHPTDSGNRQCIMQYVQTLRVLGYDVHFLLVEETGMSQEDIALTARYWGDRFLHFQTPRWQVLIQKAILRMLRYPYPDIMDFWYPAGLNAFLDKTHRKLDFSGLIVNYVWMSRAARCGIPVKALFTHDVFTDRRRLIPSQRWHSYSMRNERKAVRRFQHVLAVQDREREYFQALSPLSDVRTVYCGFTFVPQPVTISKNILFFSSGGQLNLNGIRRFIREAFPLLKAVDPEVRLLLGGSICDWLKDEKLPEGITLKGRYDNPSDFYALGDICVNPVFEGSGLKIKTMESIAHGKLTVVDPHDAIGIHQSESAPLLIARSKEDFREMVLSALQNRELLEKNQRKCAEYITSLNNHILKQYSSVFGQ